MTSTRTFWTALLAVGVALMIMAPVATAQVTVDLTNVVVDYKCYVVAPGPALNKEATLSDQFDAIRGGVEDVLIQQPQFLCNPAIKTTAEGVFGGPSVTVDDVTVILPHLKCYKIVPSRTINLLADLTTPQFDDTPFETENDARISAAQYLCTTVTKSDIRVGTGPK
jgi:hypothetical protein